MGYRARAQAMRTLRVEVLDTENMEAFPAREPCPLKRKEKGEAPSERMEEQRSLKTQGGGAVRGDQEGSMFFWVRVRAGRCPGLCSCHSFELKCCLGPLLFIFSYHGKVHNC